MPDGCSCVNWNSTAPDRHKASEQPPGADGTEMSILAQISEHGHLGFVLLAPMKLQVAAEGGGLW